MTDFRKHFFDELLKMAKADDKVLCLTADLGFSFKEQFDIELSEQIINVGICEQNMVGMAAGMAIKGYKPYCYSNALFLTSRANEQIRNDICYNNLNVKLVATSANDFLGFTHVQNPKDEANRLLSTFPNIKILNPNNIKELKQAMCCNGPAFINI